MTPPIPNDYDETETRLEAMKVNIEWLQEHDLQENSQEAAKRLGLIKGDVLGIIEKEF